MTCQQFRQLNKDDASLFQMTRGERSSCVHHYVGCWKCQRWVRELPKIAVTVEEAVASDLATLTLIARDQSDPEFHRESR